MSTAPPEITELTIDEKPWPEIELPPTDLPYDDGEPMESPWHFGNAALLVAGYVAARGGRRDDYFVGANMFLYYSTRQVRDQDYKGPDVFIVKNVDGAKKRLSWIVWDEDGRYPDVIVELLSPSTEREDLGPKKRLYEQTFRTPEYFCCAPEVERLLGWRMAASGVYESIAPDERGWLWSEELGLWLGPWQGTFLGEEHTWLRFYAPDGELVLLPDEAALRRAEAERQRAEEFAARVAALEAELSRLRGGEPPA
ncbi:MAG: Uma2 family endonuclease [Ardenticatenaceae bacterium]|nr:Uma2 family endonuclease [Ardenticatenaceae bacterium]